MIDVVRLKHDPLMIERLIEFEVLRVDLPPRPAPLSLRPLTPGLSWRVLMISALASRPKTFLSLLKYTILLGPPQVRAEPERSALVGAHLLDARVERLEQRDGNVAILRHYASYTTCWHVN